MANKALNGEIELLKEPFRTLIAAAILAPSGDNTQPWRFEIDEERTSIKVCVDTRRDSSPMNSGQRMARIACGAAIENILQVARFNDWEAAIELHNSPVEIATIRISGDLSAHGSIEARFRNRYTNRRAYNAIPASQTTMQCLIDSVQAAAETALIWITQGNSLKAITDIIAQSDALMFGDPIFRQAFLANVRFDRPAAEQVQEGLSIGSLGLTRIERMALSHIELLPIVELRSWVMRRATGSKAKRLIRSASGLCFITSYENSVSADVAVGRMMQRSWLSLTEQHFAVQPMMSLPVLLSATSFTSFPKHDQVEALAKQAKAILGIPRGQNIAAILRFGYANDPIPSRTGRRELKSCITGPSRVPQYTSCD
jgi:hypothetical protein